MLTLRPYQRELNSAILRALESGIRRPLGVLPPGAGKTLCYADLARTIQSQWPGVRILISTHVQELIAQGIDTVKAHWPDAPLCTYAAGLGYRETGEHLMIGQIQSIYNKVDQVGYRDLVIIDEAHLVPQKGHGMYRTMLGQLRSINPKLCVAGLTATPYRLDSGRLCEGDDRVFDQVVHEVSIDTLIPDYLSMVVPYCTENMIDTRNVAIQNGQFHVSQLEEVCVDRALIESMADELVEKGRDRNHWLVFCATQKQARLEAQALEARGIKCEVLVSGGKNGHSPLTKTRRQEVIAAYKSGEIRALVGCNIFVAGFDAPNTDLLVCKRPTVSPGLWVQLVGRGTRKSPGKSDCLMLDFAHNTRRHGPINAIRPPRDWKAMKDPSGDPATKSCPNCEAECPVAVRECANCGHQFPEREVKLVTQTSSDEIIEIGGKKRTVETWLMHEHVGPSGTPSLKVTYNCTPSLAIREWVCVEHPTGLPREKAVAWWRKHGGQEPVPISVEQAISRSSELTQPVALQTVTEKGYPKITGRWF